MKLVKIQATTSEDRHKIINDVNNLISKCGWIIDSKFYSNKSVFFSCEIDNPKLFSELFSKLKVNILGENVDLVENLKHGKEIRLTLNITFFHNEKDLIIETPAVPG